MGVLEGLVELDRLRPIASKSSLFVVVDAEVVDRGAVVDVFRDGEKGYELVIFAADETDKLMLVVLVKIDVDEMRLVIEVAEGE